MTTKKILTFRAPARKLPYPERYLTLRITEDLGHCEFRGACLFLRRDDLVYADTEGRVECGELAAVRIRDRVGLRHVCADGKGYTLWRVGRREKSKHLPAAEVHVLGPVVSVLQRPNWLGMARALGSTVAMLLAFTLLTGEGLMARSRTGIWSQSKLPAWLSFDERGRRRYGAEASGSEWQPSIRRA